jgi:hypothetical protein
MKINTLSNVAFSLNSNFILLASSLILIIQLVSFPSYAQDTGQKTGQDPSKDEFNYTLESQPDDTPNLTKLKAGLRLLVAYSQVHSICEKCSLETALNSYDKANGNTIAQVVKTLSGISPDWKPLTEKAIEEGVAKLMSDNSCKDLGEQIKSGQWAIYKGRFEGDYKLIMGK